MKVNDYSEEYGISPAILRDGSQILNVRFLMKQIVVQRYIDRVPSMAYEPVHMRGYGFMYIYDRLVAAGAFEAKEDHFLREDQIYVLMMMDENRELVENIFKQYAIDVMTILFGNTDANAQKMFDGLDQIVIAGPAAGYEPIFDGIKLFVDTYLPSAS